MQIGSSQRWLALVHLSTLVPRHTLVARHTLVPRLRLGTHCLAGSACRIDPVEAEHLVHFIPVLRLGTKISDFSFRVFGALLTVFLICGSGCISRSENRVVLYCAVDREFAAPILDAYERKHDKLEILRQFDVESNKSVGLANRIIEEQAAVRCDVFWNGEILQTIRLQQAGLLASHRWSVPKNFPELYLSSDGTWVSVCARARILLINTDALPDRSKWPTSVDDLSKPKWKDRCGLASPFFGSCATHMTVLASQQGVRFWPWIEEVQENAVTLSGNKQVAQAVSHGELAWGLTDTDDALIEQENGGHVEIVFPDQSKDKNGLLLIPNTVAIMRDAPHRVAAGQLADSLFSEQTADRLTMAAGAQFNLWPGKKVSKQFDNLNSMKQMQPDFETAASQWSTTLNRLAKIFRKSTVLEEVQQ